MAAENQSSVARGWDPYKTFHLSPKEKQAVAERAEMRSSLKKEWQRKVSSPHRGVGGNIFDPAVQRFIALRADHWYYFKQKPKNALFAIGVLVAPVSFFTWWLHTEHRDKEKMYRTGQIAYADRQFKHV